MHLLPDEKISTQTHTHGQMITVSYFITIFSAHMLISYTSSMLSDCVFPKNLLDKMQYF